MFSQMVEAPGSNERDLSTPVDRAYQIFSFTRHGHESLTRYDHWMENIINFVILQWFVINPFYIM